MLFNVYNTNVDVDLGHPDRGVAQQLVDGAASSTCTAAGHPGGLMRIAEPGGPAGRADLVCWWHCWRPALFVLLRSYLDDEERLYDEGRITEVVQGPGPVTIGNVEWKLDTLQAYTQLVDDEGEEIEPGPAGRFGGHRGHADRDAARGVLR